MITRVLLGYWIVNFVLLGFIIVEGIFNHQELIVMTMTINNSFYKTIGNDHFGILSYFLYAKTFSQRL